MTRFGRLACTCTPHPPYLSLLDSALDISLVVTRNGPDLIYYDKQSYILHKLTNSAWGIDSGGKREVSERVCQDWRRLPRGIVPECVLGGSRVCGVCKWWYVTELRPKQSLCRGWEGQYGV